MHWRQLTGSKSQQIMRFLAQELLRTCGLIVGVVLVVGVLVQWLFGEGDSETRFFRGVFDFVASSHVSVDGVPLWQPTWAACRETLPLLALAILLLILLSMVLGSVIVVAPRLQWIKMLVIGVSAVPSFLLPFLPYLFDPSREFTGFTSDSPLLFPALALAIGDLNLIAATSAFSETLRHEMSRPHVRLSRALRGLAWLDLWPRSAVAILGAIGARIPHLLGGTIALEMLFNIDGLGNMAYQAIFRSPPDYHALLWICGVGIIVSRVLYVLFRVGKAALLPTVSAQDDGPDASCASSDAPAAARIWTPETREATDAVDFEPADSPVPEELPRPPGWLPLSTWTAKIRFYLRLNPVNWVKLCIAFVLWLACLAGWTYLIDTWLALPPYSQAETYDPYMSSSAEHPMGTNGVGDDVVECLARGIGQQLPPLLLALAISLSTVPAAMLHVLGGFLPGLGGWLTRAAAALFEVLVELVESIPKLIILLACVSFFSSEPFSLTWGGTEWLSVAGPSAFVLKLYIVIGLIHVPQVYRAIRDDLAVLDQSVFLEAAKTARIPLRRIVTTNLLRNHCLHVVFMQSALLTASVVHVDAMLGFVGIRNLSEIFTWGSVLGTGIIAFEYDAQVAVYAGIPFNAGVLWGPLLAVWLTIVAAFTVADALKIPWGGYVYRFK